MNNTYPQYIVKPFFSHNGDGITAKEPSGYDVWELSGPQSEVVVDACDSLEEAEQSAKELRIAAATLLKK